MQIDVVREDGEELICGVENAESFELGVVEEQSVEISVSYEDNNAVVLPMYCEESNSVDVKEFHSHSGDVAIAGDLTVGGTARIEHLIHPFGMMFESLDALKVQLPNPQIGWWAMIGSNYPFDYYYCKVQGVWDRMSDTDVKGEVTAQIASGNYASKAWVDTKLGSLPKPITLTIGDVEQYLRQYGYLRESDVVETDVTGKFDASEFKELFEKTEIGTKSDGSPIYAIRAKLGLYTSEFLSAMGEDGAIGGGGSVEVLQNWENYDELTMPGVAMSAKLGYDMRRDIATLASRTHKHGLSEIIGFNDSLSGKAELIHQHSIGDVDGLQSALDGKAGVHAHPYLSETYGAVIASKLDASVFNSFKSGDFATLNANLGTLGASFNAFKANDFGALKNSFEGFKATFESAFEIGFDGSVKAKVGLASLGYLSALGTDTTAGGGGASYDRLDDWGDYSADKVMGAVLGKALRDDMQLLKNAGYITASALSDYALKSHTHSDYALVSHSHSGYALLNHSHGDYALLGHTHDYSPLGHTHGDYVVAFNSVQSDTHRDANNMFNSRSFIGSAYLTTNAPNGTAWYNVIQLAYRNGESDGADWVGQIALQMTDATGMWFRRRRSEGWNKVSIEGHTHNYFNNAVKMYYNVENNNDCATGKSGHYAYQRCFPIGLSGLYNYGGVLNFRYGDESFLNIYYNHISSSSGQGLYYRTGFGQDIRGWARILDSNNFSSFAAIKDHEHPYFKVLPNNFDLNAQGDKNGNNGISYINCDNVGYDHGNQHFVYGSVLNLSTEASSVQIGIKLDNTMEFRHRWWSGGGGVWKPWKKILCDGDNGIRIGSAVLTYDSATSTLKLTKEDGSQCHFAASGGVSSLA